MKRSYLNAALAALALILVAAVWFSQKKPESKGAPLTALAEDAVSKIAIQHPDKPEIDLEKKNGNWSLTAPVAVAADPFEVKSLTGLAIAETHSVIDEAAKLKLADFGLDPPGYSVVLNDTRLDFGNVEPLKYQRYVRIGDKLALIDDPPSQALDADYSDLAAKRLLPEGAEIAKIEVPTFSVERAASGPGWIVQPANAAVSSDALQKFADAWREARANWNSAAQAADKPAPETATVTLNDGSALRFGIVSREPQLVLERADLKLLYNLPKTEVDRLLKLPEGAAKPEDKSASKPAP